MTLSDPTSGAGYAYGAKLPSTHMTTIATQQVRALDIVSGGTYTCVGAVTVTENALRTHNLAYTAGTSCCDVTLYDDARLLANTTSTVTVAAGITTSFAGTTKLLGAVCLNYAAFTSDAAQQMVVGVNKVTMTPTATRNLTLPTGVAAGHLCHIRITNSAVAQVLVIKDSATTVATTGTSFTGSITCCYTGTVWFALMWSNDAGWTIAV